MAKPLLSISMLSSGRPESLWKCLDSLNKIRDHISSELIIVDTGCDSEVRKKMESYTDHIISFSWCNDFAKARNAGLLEANGEWFYFLDDDEAVLDAEDLIAFFKTGDYRNYDTASYVIRNYLTPDLKTYEDTTVTRMKRITEETRFVGKIHERLVPPAEKTKVLRSVVEHFGYIFRTADEKRKHSERNIPPLLDMLKLEPKEPHWIYQLIQEYHSIEEYEKELELCDRGLALKNEHFDGFFAFRKANALAMAGKTTEACSYAKVLLENKQAILRIPRARLLAFVANLTYRTDPEYCEAACLEYLDLYQELSDKPEECLQQGGNLIHDAFHEKSLCVVCTSLIICGLQKDEDRYLLSLYRDLPLDQCPIPNLQAYAATIFDAVHRLPYKAEYEAVLEGLSKYIAEDDAYLQECRAHLRNGAVSGIQQMAEKLRQQAAELRSGGNEAVAEQIEAQLRSLGL